jgi:hypothetical protein
MKTLWKHIAHSLPNKLIIKYFLLGLIAVFAEDVIAHTHSPLVVTEKEKSGKEKEISEEGEYELQTACAGKFKRIKTKPPVVCEIHIITVLAYPFLPTMMLESASVGLPTFAWDTFAHSPRYIYFRNLLI